MLARSIHPEPPNDDQRWKPVIATMRRYGFAAHALIETLHTVQSTFGYQDEVAMRFVAESLRVPLSRVYGVATFYHFFQLKPPGEHTCVVCAAHLLEAMDDRYGIKPGETTADGKVSLLTARCLGSCGLAPAAVLDGNVEAKITPPALLENVQRMALREHVKVELDAEEVMAS